MKLALGGALWAWLLASVALAAPGDTTAQPDAGIPAPAQDSDAGISTPVPPTPLPPAQGADAGTEAPLPPPTVQEQPQAGTPQPPPPPPEPPRKRRHRGPDRSMNSISANVVRPFFFEFSGSFERALTDLLSIDLDFTFVRADRHIPRGTTSVDGFGVMFGARFFLLGKAPAGLFVGPDVEVLNLDVKEPFGAASGTSFAVGGEAGYAIILWDHLYLSASAGAEVVFGWVAYSGAQARGYGWTPLYKGLVGVAF